MVDTIIIILFSNQLLTHLKPAKALSKVDFPAPEGPKMAVSRPDLNTPHASLIMGVDPLVAPFKL